MLKIVCISISNLHPCIDLVELHNLVDETQPNEHLAKKREKISKFKDCHGGWKCKYDSSS